MGLQYKRRDNLEKLFDEFAIDPDKDEKEKKEDKKKKASLTTQATKPMQWKKQ